MQTNSEIKCVVRQLKKMADVKKIMLFHKKNSLNGGLSAFKICAVIETIDKPMLEMRIYREIDSEIPFDVVIYTPEEWRILSEEKGTFANKVAKTGCEIIE